MESEKHGVYGLGAKVFGLGSRVGLWFRVWDVSKSPVAYEAAYWAMGTGRSMLEFPKIGDPNKAP